MEINTPIRNKRLDSLRNSCSSPCLTFPSSPFMKHLGFGTGVNVYLVERSPKHGQYRSPWAVKKINKKCKGNSIEYVNRLKEEAEILKGLHHKNIIGFRSFSFSVDGSDCLAMEDGQKSLLSMIENRTEKQFGPFPARNILQMACQVADGLNYLHNDMKLLHGDLKSANLLIKGDFKTIKICDFGVSIRLDQNLMAKEADYVGTEPWTSKDILERGKVSDKADIYAFAMCIYEMLTLGIPHMHVFPEEECYDNNEKFEKDFAQAEIDYENALGTRPPLVNYEFDMSYTPAIELFWACSHTLPSDRPSSEQIVNGFKQQFEYDHALLPDPKVRLTF